MNSNPTDGEVYSIQLYDKVCQWPTTGQWYSTGVLRPSSTNKTDRHDITEILLKVALNTINHNPCMNAYDFHAEEIYDAPPQISRDWPLIFLSGQ